MTENLISRSISNNRRRYFARFNGSFRDSNRQVHPPSRVRFSVTSTSETNKWSLVRIISRKILDHLISRPASIEIKLSSRPGESRVERDSIQRPRSRQKWLLIVLDDRTRGIKVDRVNFDAFSRFFIVSKDTRRRRRRSIVADVDQKWSRTLKSQRHIHARYMHEA